MLLLPVPPIFLFYFLGKFAEACILLRQLCLCSKLLCFPSIIFSEGKIKTKQGNCFENEKLHVMSLIF